MSTAFPHGPRRSPNWFSGFESLVMLLPKAQLSSSACFPKQGSAPQPAGQGLQWVVAVRDLRGPSRASGTAQPREEEDGGRRKQG